MSVNVILDLHVSPENREELLSFLTATLADTRAYKGYISSVMIFTILFY
jgi:quinol monooxygenase YgiN